MDFKRICIFSDGTWETRDSETPTNIARLAMAVRKQDDDGVQQLVFYDEGVGTSVQVDRIVGGYLAAALDRNIRQLYTTLALNYDIGDEVYLFGFSRGSYTVRSLAGMIAHAGLVGRTHIDQVGEAYELYRGGTDADADAAVAFREKFGEPIPITCLACFDTVGALGIPQDSGIIGSLNRKRYQFRSKSITKIVAHGIHVLGIDEQRKPYTPTRMTAHETVGEQQVTERFLWGTHAVGGGKAVEQDTASVALHFVVDELLRRGLLLSFDAEALPPAGDVTAILPESKPSFPGNLLSMLFGTEARHIESADVVDASAKRRYRLVDSWRPEALTTVSQELLEGGDDDEDEVVDRGAEVVQDEAPEEAGDDAGDEAIEGAGVDTGGESGAGADFGDDAGGEAGEEVGEEADVEAGDEAGDEADVEAGDEAGDEADVEAGDEADVEAGDEADVEAGDDAGANASDEGGNEEGGEGGDDAGDDAGNEEGGEEGGEAGDEAGGEAGEEVGDEAEGEPTAE